jgi:hypothetical protein
MIGWLRSRLASIGMLGWKGAAGGFDQLLLGSELDHWEEP